MLQSPPPPFLQASLSCVRLNSRRNSTCIWHLPATAGKCQTEVQNILKPKVEFGVAKKCQFPAFLCNKKICQTKCQTEKVNYLNLIHSMFLFIFTNLPKFVSAVMRNLRLTSAHDNMFIMDNGLNQTVKKPGKSAT